MSNQMIEWIFAAIYMLLGPGAWMLFGLGMVKGRKRLDLLRKPLPAFPDSPPHVTVLIPAKDEGERMEGCLRSALSQDYPRFDVIAIDDRSKDQTGAVMDRLAAEDSLLSVLHIHDGELPVGWTGKAHALHKAAPSAKGDWLCFVDSDVVIQPDVLRATISLAEYKQFDLVSLLPKMQSESFWESLMVPLGGAATSAMYLLPYTNANDSKIAFANGQYLMIRRSIYDAVGGHDAVHHALSEDVQLARRVKQMGHRPRLALGSDYAAVRMYDSRAAVFKGWARQFYGGSLGRPWRILGACLFMLLCCFSAYAAIGWGIYRQLHPVLAIGGLGWLASAAVHVGLMLFFICFMYKQSGNEPKYGLLFPVSSLLLFWIFCRALTLCVTRKVEWRGTVYQGGKMKPAST